MGLGQSKAGNVYKDAVHGASSVGIRQLILRPNIS